MSEEHSDDWPTMPEVDFSTIGPPQGQRLIDVRLPDQTGSIVDLHQHRAGRPAMIVVHRSADW